MSARDYSRLSYVLSLERRRIAFAFAFAAHTTNNDSTNTRILEHERRSDLASLPPSLPPDKPQANLNLGGSCS